MLDMIDDWLVWKKRMKEETQREVLLSLYAIKYPDTLLIESLTDRARSDVRRLSATSLHSPYLLDMGRGYKERFVKLGIQIPSSSMQFHSSTAHTFHQSSF